MAAIAATVAKEQLPVNQKDAAAIDEGGIAGWLPFLVFAFFIFTVIARTRNGQRKFSSDGWGRSAGIILGSGLGYGTQRGLGRGWGGLGGGGGGGGGFSGGGGGFDGGGASGNW
jgi:uncharacterized protein